MWNGRDDKEKIIGKWNGSSSAKLQLSAEEMRRDETEVRCAAAPSWELLRYLPKVPTYLPEVGKVPLVIGPRACRYLGYVART